MKLDHVVVAVRNLDEAIEQYRALGFTVVKGGIHANRATQNALIVFSDGTYIELLALTGEAPLPDLIDFSAMINGEYGLKGFALGTDDIDAEVERLRGQGVRVGGATPGERRRQDGTVIRWKLALIDGGFSPFLIKDVTLREWRVPADPATTTHANGVLSIWSVDGLLKNAAWADYLRFVNAQITHLAQIK